MRKIISTILLVAILLFSGLVGAATAETLGPAVFIGYGSKSFNVSPVDGEICRNNSVLVNFNTR